MSKVEERVVNQIQCILELWKVTYNVEDEKYVAKTKWNVVLNCEQIEWIAQIGLSIFSIEKFDEYLVVRFAPGGHRSG